MDRLSEVFSALADPTRRAILARLAEGEATVNQIAEPFSISLQAVSKHLKVLERAGAEPFLQMTNGATLLFVNADQGRVLTGRAEEADRVMRGYFDPLAEAGVEPGALAAKGARVGTALAGGAVAGPGALIASFAFAAFGRAAARVQESRRPGPAQPDARPRGRADGR